MDKALELRLIEEHFDPYESSEIDLNYAARYMKGRTFSSNRNFRADMILFDGRSSVTVRADHTTPVIDKPALAVTGGDVSSGLFIYAVSEPTGERASVYIENENNDLVIVVGGKKGYLPDQFQDIFVKNKAGEQIAKVEFHRAEDTAILRLPHVDHITKDELFWKHMADRFDLELNPIENQYTGEGASWYETFDMNSGTSLTLGTRKRVYAVKSTFDQEKSSEELQSIIADLNISPQSVGSSWDPEFTKSGTECETHIYKGHGDQVVAYLANLLQVN